MEETEEFRVRCLVRFFIGRGGRSFFRIIVVVYIELVLFGIELRTLVYSMVVDRVGWFVTGWEV